MPNACLSPFRIIVGSRRNFGWNCVSVLPVFFLFCNKSGKRKQVLPPGCQVLTSGWWTGGRGSLWWPRTKCRTTGRRAQCRSRGSAAGWSSICRWCRIARGRIAPVGRRFATPPESSAICALPVKWTSGKIALGFGPMCSADNRKVNLNPSTQLVVSWKNCHFT